MRTRFEESPFRGSARTAIDRQSGSVRILFGASRVPALPDSVARLAHMSDDPRIGTMAFLETLLTDPELSRETLAAANAAYFAPSRPCPRVREAITVLGTRHARYVAMIAGVRGRLLASTPAPAGFDRSAFWRHCVATGFAAESLARSVGEPLPETVFVAGLLHDVGLLVLDRNDPAALADVIGLRADGHDQARIEQEVVGATHAEIGRTAGRMWGLPPIVTEAITAHHEPCSCTGNAFRVAALVRAADWLTSEPDTVWSSDVVDADDPLLRAAGIGPEAREKAVHEATARLDELNGLLILDSAGTEPRDAGRTKEMGRASDG